MSVDQIWQQAAINKLSKTNGKGIIWATVGRGKSRCAYRLFAKLQSSQHKSETRICLVICRRKAFYDWSNEITNCGYDWKVFEHNTKRIRFSPKKSCIWLISIDMLPKMWHLLIQFDHLIKYVVYDELYLFANVKAKRTRAAIELSKNLSASCIGLSGTIMPANDNVTIWGQASVIGIQHLLAGNLTEFRTKYQISFEMLGVGCRVYKNKPNSKQLITNRLDRFIYLYFPKEKRRILHKFNRVPVSDAQSKLIKQLKDEYYANLDGKELDIKVAIDLCGKIRSVANGWIKDNEGGIHYVKSHKLDALEQSVTETLAAGEQVLIWCAFKHDIEILQKHFSFATLQMVGGKPFDHAAWQSGNYNVVIATEASGASVNHFSKVKYAKYFSMDYRWLNLQQSRGRTNRGIISGDVHYEYFFVEQTLDETVYDTALASGATEQDFIKAAKIRLNTI